jgi:hypothetical protein
MSIIALLLINGVPHTESLGYSRSLRLTMDRARRIPMEGWQPRFLAQTGLDRISQLSITLQGSPKSILDILAEEILARQADVEMCIVTVMNASPDVLQQICSR